VLEKSQPEERGRATEVTVSSLPKLDKTSSLMLKTLHHLVVLNFVVTGLIPKKDLTTKDYSAIAPLLKRQVQL
jgi:hypothetical protein